MNSYTALNIVKISDKCVIKLSCGSEIEINKKHIDCFALEDEDTLYISSQKPNREYFINTDSIEAIITIIE